MLWTLRQALDNSRALIAERPPSLALVGELARQWQLPARVWLDDLAPSRARSAGVAPPPAGPRWEGYGHGVMARLSRGRVTLTGELPSAPLRRRRAAARELLALVAFVEPELEAEVYLHLEDIHPEAPAPDDAALVFNRRTGAPPGLRILPDPHFTTSRGHLLTRWSIDRAAVPWQRRRSLAFWRGSSTGGSLRAGEDPHQNARVRLCLESRRHSALLDARLGRIVNCDDGSRRTLEQLGIVGAFVAPARQTAYRYLVSIDGWAGEWDGLYWKLYSGSTVLRVESAWEQWYTGQLAPWEHYVPVRADLSDLAERIEWCRKHDDEARAIADRARRLIEHAATFRHAVEHSRRQLREMGGAA